MRADSGLFAVHNARAAKSPRFVVKVEFTSQSLYLSSHDDIEDIPSTHFPGCLIEPSIASQKLNPDQGRAEIGAASFVLADQSGAVTEKLHELLSGREGLRDRMCRFYLGYEGMAFADFVLVGSQLVKEAVFDRGAYRIACNDIQRSARKDIFVLATTTLSATVEATDTTISVYSTAGFETCYHGTSWSDAASSTVGYLKIKDEVIRYTGKTATSFTGCTRGVLGTEAARYVVDSGTTAARREKVTEYVYLELPGPKLLYAILTGSLYGSGYVLPSKWHLGIPAALVAASDFTGIGKDLWDTTTDANGVILRFEGLQKTDGKAFAELEVLRLLGLFMPVYADGRLGLRRMTRVLADATGVVTLDESNSTAVGDLQHDMDSLHNAFTVQWNWNGKDYTRTTTYLDADSVSAHGRATELELKYKGLYGGRHTDGLIFKLLDTLRDRYSAPPVRHRRDVFHSLNRIEVGDVVRVRDDNVRDYSRAGAGVDRAFEVQSVSVNHRTGVVSLDLFGSTSEAAVISPTTAVSALPDAFYTAAGTNLASVFTITSGVVSGGPYTLAGGSDLTASGSVWYYNGDLTIPAGVTVNVSGNVQLRIKGYLTLNGTITGIGGGLAAVPDDTNAATLIAGNPGFVGNSRGHDGCLIRVLETDNIRYKTLPPATTVARNASFPYVALAVSGNSLLGLPTDLRGSGGGPGGKIVKIPRLMGLSLDWMEFKKSGGAGSAGGAGLCTVSRGLGLGSSARINLSGADAAAPTAWLTHIEGRDCDFFPGTGGSGGPGSWLVLIDGGLLSVPDLSGRFIAKTGKLTLPAYRTALSGTAEEKWKRKHRPFAGYLGEPSAMSTIDLSYSCQRVQYIAAEETPATDVDTLPAVTGVTAWSGSAGYIVTFTPASGTPPGTVYEVWEHTASTPFASAVKRMEGAATAFFVPRNDTTVVYCWIRARLRNSAGVTVYSATTPPTAGVPAGAAAMPGTYATVAPSSLSKSAAASSMTTASASAALVGATATSWSWARISGSTSISANSASAATTTFTATGVGVGVTVSAVFRVTINGSYTADVAVDCTNSGAVLAITANPTSVSKTQDASTITTASVTAAASGGAGGYAYAWTKVSGGSISAVSPSAATTAFSGSAMTENEQRSATFRCTVTDSASATATVDVTVTIRRETLILTLSSGSLYKVSAKTSITSDAVTATPANGTLPYAYSWSRVSGSSGITVTAPTAAFTQFRGTGFTLGEIRMATFRCTVTDAAASVATADVDVTLEYFGGTFE